MSSQKIWFVTGASSGFGRAQTECVLAKGDIVVATLRKPEMLADLTEKYGSDRLLVLKLDVTSRDEIVAAFAKAQEVYGRIDVVYNNAGYGLNGEVEGVPDDLARGIFDVNFWGAVHVSQEAVRFFRDVNKPSGGRLLQMSSASGIQAIPCVGFYTASKFALEGISEAMAAELHPDWNIKVTILEPGVFQTDGLSKNLVFAPPHPAYGEGTLPHMFRAVLKAGTVPYTFSKVDVMCERVYKAASTPDLPLRLPLGRAAMDAYQIKSDSLKQIHEIAKAWNENIDIV
ncbi:hypothetical protein B0H21DRAFT_779899 [Amylocystis lapponica]|nr:hypothetical protein B0H21DRAFT_779899 [Amylocystis lapponica]